MANLHLSRIGDQFNRLSGTRLLMDDLGRVQQAPGTFINLGGGNPSQVPALHEWFSDKLAALASARNFDQLFSTYDDPLGSVTFRDVFAGFLRDHLGWRVTRENVLCTAGSQASFFMLFNILAGPDHEGLQRRILFPQCPEYIGYNDLCLATGGLTAVASRPVITGVHRFRYEIDFAAIEIDATISAVCISRPTNPSGNVCSDEEMKSLSQMAKRHRIPLIVDCAYGDPFPGITFHPGQLEWFDNLVTCFSLSKLGLPGMRVGIVVARPDLIQVLSNMNAAMVLTTNPIGTRLAHELFESRRVLEMVDSQIRPFYLGKAKLAIECCDRFFAGLDYFLHEPGGAIFLWVWFRGLPITAAELYERLKARGVLVIPGHLFAPGLAQPTPQMAQCIRISYAQPAALVEHGLRIIAEEVRAAYDGA